MKDPLSLWETIRAVSKFTDPVTLMQYPLKLKNAKKLWKLAKAMDPVDMMLHPFDQTKEIMKVGQSFQTTMPDALSTMADQPGGFDLIQQYDALTDSDLSSQIPREPTLLDNFSAAVQTAISPYTKPQTMSMPKVYPFVATSPYIRNKVKSIGTGDIDGYGEY